MMPIRGCITARITRTAARLAPIKKSLLPELEQRQSVRPALTKKNQPVEKKLDRRAKILIVVKDKS
jgi:hypothetical protein